jgi:hypothetical protein
MTRPCIDDLEASGQVFSCVYVKFTTRLIIVHVSRYLTVEGTSTRSRCGFRPSTSVQTGSARRRRPSKSEGTGDAR